MKKNNLLLLLLFALLSTTSCNKIYNCQCSSGGRVVKVIPIRSLLKLGAKNVCDSYQEQNNRNGARQVCSIK